MYPFVASAGRLFAPSRTFQGSFGSTDGIAAVSKVCNKYPSIPSGFSPYLLFLMSWINNTISSVHYMLSYS